jgi:hypothetical protein
MYNKEEKSHIKKYIIFFYMTELLKQYIEKMDKMHHIEILKIISNNPDSKINENKSGVYINLSLLSETTINEIQKYIVHVKYQEELLNPVESQKTSLKNTFYKDGDSVLYSNVNETNIQIEYMSKPNKDTNVSIFSYE